MREQIAFAPSSLPASPAAPGDVPPWLGKLDRMSAPSISRPPAQSALPDTPPGLENSLSGAVRPFSPGRSRLPQRELHSKVWEGEDAASPGPDAPVDQRNGQSAPSQNVPGEQKEERAQVPPTPRQEQAEEASEVEDLPTVLMPSTIAGEKDEQALTPAAQHDPPVSDNTQAGEEDRGDADLPTRPMVVPLSPADTVHAQHSSKRPFPAQSYRQAVAPQPPPGQLRDSRQQGFPAQAGPNLNQSPLRQQPVRPATPPSSPGFLQAPVTGERAAGPSPSRSTRRKSEKPGMIVLVILPVSLLIVLAAALIYWITAYQPFSVPAVTRTSLSFNNTKLGIALQYPQGWTSQLDSVHQTASFFDANRVDQVTISVTPVNSSSVPTYVNREAAQIGLTAQKSLSPVTFAGTTWQRVQGTLLVSGATDTEILLVARHGKHFYTLAQIAPAATYADADRLFFSMFRASFQFL